MADTAPRVTVPASFHPLDEAVYVDGSATTAWLGREISRDVRWLDYHLRRQCSEAYPQNSDTVAVPIASNQAGVLIPPVSHYGTPGVRRGAWYLRASFTAAATCVVQPYVSTPAIYPPGRPGATAGTMTGTGAAANYGPFATPLREGACRCGLILFPHLAAGAADDSGSVALAHTDTIVSTAADFVALTRPYPMIRLLDGEGQAGHWTQIVGVGETTVPGDTVYLADWVTHVLGWIDADSKPAYTWETKAQANGVAVYSKLLVEVVT